MLPSIYFPSPNRLPLGTEPGDLYGEEQTLALQPGSEGLDTFIDSTSPNSNFGTNAQLRTGDDDGTGDRAVRSLIKIDLSLSGIAGSAEIVSARLCLYEFLGLSAGGAPTSWNVHVNRLLRDWVESQATHIIYSMGNNWDSAGANTDGVDRAANATDSVILDAAASNDFIEWDVTEDVRGFIDGTITNYGWLVHAPTIENLGTARAMSYFYSSDHPIAAQRPKLIIIYREKSNVTANLPRLLQSFIPAIVIGFDDGYDDVYDQAFLYMQPRNMVATAYVITDYIGGAGYMTASELQEMDAAGWDIANHTTNHPNLAALSEAEQEIRLGGAETALNALGLTRASRHVAYPGGVYNANTLTAMSNLGMLSGRTILNGNDIIPNLVWYELPSFLIGDTTTLQDAKNFVDLLIANGTVGTVYLHYLVNTVINPNEWAISNFRLWIDYILGKKLTTLSITQLYGLRTSDLAYRVPWD